MPVPFSGLREKVTRWLASRTQGATRAHCPKGEAPHNTVTRSPPRNGTYPLAAEAGIPPRTHNKVATHQLANRGPLCAGSADLISLDIPHIALSEAEAIASRQVEQVLNHYSASGRLLTSALDTLLALAVHRDPAIARVGTDAIFGSIVERLSDSFEPSYCDLYDRIFAHLISRFRQTERGRAVGRMLSRFGIHDAKGVLERRSRLRSAPVVPPKRPPALAVVLSRITLGADVACTGVVISAVRHLYPNAEVLFAGTRASYDLFRGDGRVSHLEVGYDRRGAFAERIGAWLCLVEALDAELARRGRLDYIVIDPDSRLTQLGLLPVTDDDRRYHYFESRSYRREGVGEIARLTAMWMSERFGSPDTLLPALCLASEDRTLASEVRRRLRESGAERVVSISFGVGGNERKRLGAAFEHELLRALLRRGHTVLLTCGGSREEIKDVEATVGCVAQEGWAVTRWHAEELRRGTALAPRPPAVVLWQGDTGAFAAAIQASDLYIGYDSAGQHLAAALSVPTICVFTGGTPSRHMERWRACGPGPVRCIQAPGAGQALTAVLSAVENLAGPT